MVLAKDKAAKLGVAPDAPAADRLKAIDGMAIATPSATSGFNAPVQAAAAKFGAKINFISIAQPAMAAALKSGAVTAFMASSPFWEPAILQGFGTVWLTTPKPGELPDEFVPISVAVLQATEDYARANPEPIAKLRAAIDELATLIKQKPDEARQLLTKAYPQVDPSSLKLAYDINSASWTKPDISAADIDHQFKITEAAGIIKDLDKIDRKSIVWPRS
jgi:ABC-type nitrate/sulfonate/bicarbonate transport system substrate-binding protein